MAKHKHVMAYRQEAAIRVAYFSIAFMVSVIVGCVVGLIAAEIFNNTNNDTRGRIFGWTAAIVFAVVCSILVYKVDTRLNKKFNTNP